MAKVAFSKLGLKKQNEVKTIIINEQNIEIKQYLPVNDKLALIGRVLTAAQDDNNFLNPIKLEVIGTIEIIMTYTNINFTEKQKEDLSKLYDLCDENNITNLIIAAIPETEYNFILQGIEDTAKALYDYHTSVLGILESVATDYSNLELDASNIQKLIGDPQNLGLLKDILTKIG